jgi:S1-C subfamily serine protease
MWIWGAVGVFLLSLGILHSGYIPSSSPLDASVIVENGSGHGSGTFIDATHVITAAHVAEAEGIRVRDATGGLHAVTKVDKPADPALDIAILTVSPPFEGETPKVACEPVSRGDKFYYYGSPLKLQFIGPIWLQALGGSYRSPDTWGLVLVDGAVEHGSSGSGVIDEHGHVVGVVVVGFGSGGGITFGGFTSLSDRDACEFVKGATQEVLAGKPQTTS